MNRKNNKRKIDRNRRKIHRRQNRVVDVVSKDENNADVNQNFEPQQNNDDSVPKNKINYNDHNLALVAKGLGHYSHAVYIVALTFLLFCLACTFQMGNPSVGKLPDFENETPYMCYLQILPNALLALLLLAGTLIFLYHLIYSLVLLNYTPKSIASHPVIVILFSWIVWFVGATILIYQSLLPGDIYNPRIVTWAWVIFIVSYFPFLYVFSKYEKIFSNSECSWGCSVGFFILLLLLIGASSEYFSEPITVVSICGAFLLGLPVSLMYLVYIEILGLKALKHTNQLYSFRNSLVKIRVTQEENNCSNYDDTILCTIFNFPTFIILIIIAIVFFLFLGWTETLWQLI